MVEKIYSAIWYAIDSIGFCDEKYVLNLAYTRLQGDETIDYEITYDIFKSYYDKFQNETVLLGNGE